MNDFSMRERLVGRHPGFFVHPEGEAEAEGHPAGSMVGRTAPYVSYRSSYKVSASGPTDRPSVNLLTLFHTQ